MSKNAWKKEKHIGSCGTYTTISDERSSVVREVWEILPDAGETYIIGACRQHNIFIQHQRIRHAINTVDPVRGALQTSICIMRRVYTVLVPNSLCKGRFTMFDYITRKILYFSFFIFLLTRLILITSTIFFFLSLDRI